MDSVAGQGIPGNFNANLSSDEYYPTPVQLQTESTPAMCRFFLRGTPVENFPQVPEPNSLLQIDSQLRADQDASSVFAKFNEFRPARD